MSDNAAKKSPRVGLSAGIHHANIRDKDRAVKRLRAAFRKINVKLSFDNKGESFDSIVVLTEISTKSAYLFSPIKVKKKTNLLFEIGFPLAISVRAVVRYCERAQVEHSAMQNSSMNHFRMYIEFKIKNDTERLALEDIYQKIRDENYVATNWHIFVTDKMQSDQRVRLQAEKLEAVVREVSQDPSEWEKKLEEDAKKKVA